MKDKKLKEDILDELSPAQLAALKQSIKEDDAGESIDYNTSKKAFDEWRRKLITTILYA